MFFQSFTCREPVFPALLIEETVFSPVYVFGFSGKKSNSYSCVVLFLHLLFYSIGSSCLFSQQYHDAL
jgi:hypothetical protein